MLKRVALLAAVALGALCAGAAAATAHPLLVTSAPAPGSIIPGSPSTVALAFSEEAVASGSGVTVTGPHGPVQLGRLTPSDGGRQLASKVRGRLAPGVYRIHWVALGDDGHNVSGQFAFGVAKANGSPPLGASAGLGGAGTAGRGGSGSSPGVVTTMALWLGVLAAALLWAGLLLVTALRRRRVTGADAAQKRLAAVGRPALIVAGTAALYGALQ